MEVFTKSDQIGLPKRLASALTKSFDMPALVTFRPKSYN
jgi:hypothetical protein